MRDWKNSSFSNKFISKGSIFPNLPVCVSNLFFFFSKLYERGSYSRSMSEEKYNFLFSTVMNETSLVLGDFSEQTSGLDIVFTKKSMSDLWDSLDEALGNSCLTYVIQTPNIQSFSRTNTCPGVQRRKSYFFTFVPCPFVKVLQKGDGSPQRNGDGSPEHN